MGGMPGMDPGQTDFGKFSLLASAPSITGATFKKVSSSFGNLKPASLNALPKSLSFGKTMWQVWHEVPYIRANTGTAWHRGASASVRNTRTNAVGIRAPPFLLLSRQGASLICMFGPQPGCITFSLQMKQMTA